MVQDALTKTIPIWAAVVNQAVAQIRQQQQQQQQAAEAPAQQHSQGLTSQPCSRDNTAQPGPPRMQAPCNREGMPTVGMPNPVTASITCSASDARSDVSLRHSGADSCSSSDCGGSIATVGKLPAESYAPCAQPDATGEACC
jgi:Rit1 N-terminal domain